MEVKEIYACVSDDLYEMELKLDYSHYVVWIDKDGHIDEMRVNRGEKLWPRIDPDTAPRIVMDYIKARREKARAAIILQPKGEYITYATAEDFAAAATGK